MRKKFTMHLLAPITPHDEMCGFYNERYGDYLPTNIYEDEFPNIYVKHEITDEEWLNAVNTILTYMMQHEYRTVEIDLDKRNEDLDPINRMSLEELREAYKKLKEKMANLDCKGGPVYDSTKK